MKAYVGIDIAARTFEMVIRQGGKASRAASFAQTPDGHAKAIRQLLALKPERIVMEATGIYYLDLAVALERAGLPVCVINPKSFHHFATLKQVASKTDSIDSALLAEYGERMEPPLWRAPETTRLSLRGIARQINRLTANRTQAKNRLHALQSTVGTLALLIEDEQEGIAQLDRRIETLQTAATNLLADSPELSAQMDALCAAKGIGMASAIAILGELCVLPAHMKSSQVSRHAGLDVRLTQSGTSVQRPARLSKAGNAYLRSALFMPAMSAVRHDPRAKAFYAALVARGKKKIQAICAVMRKYLTGLWACVQSKMPFDSTKLFSDIHLEKA